MPREYKFRGKRIDNGEWVFGDLRQDKDLCTAYISGWDYWANNEAGNQRSPFEYQIIPETIGLYTGLHDKNGREIYEGDIVHMLEVGNDFQREYVTDIKWEDCCFCMKSEKAKYYDTFLGAWSGNPETTYPLFEMTVIGNIYENSELLKGA